MSGLTRPCPSYILAMLWPTSSLLWEALPRLWKLWPSNRPLPLDDLIRAALSLDLHGTQSTRSPDP
ncbi:hypothetical protein TRAPUB_1769 [Trametes pubescens]|uniref:Uncharacterized protein n=1 Tax=Trametes pubescens TaxID=154538 RepID=A0A1M2VIE0_TRAPU|nr:hypothetical protein TRAPUB_1769 [Trametes pubescens]